MQLIICAQSIKCAENNNAGKRSTRTLRIISFGRLSRFLSVIDVGKSVARVADLNFKITCLPAHAASSSTVRQPTIGPISSTSTDLYSNSLRNRSRCLRARSCQLWSRGGVTSVIQRLSQKILNFLLYMLGCKVALEQDLSSS